MDPPRVPRLAARMNEFLCPDNVEFGEERLKVLMMEAAHLPADDIRERIAKASKDWIKDAEQYDDLTFVVMKVN